MISGHSGKSLLLAGLGLLLVTGLTAERLSTLAHLGPSDFDDAYMYLRYTNNWLAGEGLAWNPGEGAVYGVTSLLHVALLTMLRWCCTSLNSAGLLHVASGSAAIGWLAALVGIAALFSQHPRLHRNWIFWTAACVTLLAYREAFVFHAGTGMDTFLAGLANAVLVFATLQLARSPKPSTVVWAALVALLAVLARPDNLPCALLCPILAILLMTAAPRGKTLALFGALSICGLAILALTTWVLLGSPLPLSFFAKQPFYYGGFAGEFSWNPFLFLKVFGQSAWPFAVALVLFADRTSCRRAAVLLLPPLASMVALCWFNQIMGHLGRFFFPFLSFFVATGALTFDEWLVRIQAGEVIHLKTLGWRAVLAIAVVVFGNLGLSIGAGRFEARAQTQKLALSGGFHVVAQTSLSELDSWQAAHAISTIAAAAPSGTSFAMSEHGLPGALAPHIRIIDVLGLHDPFFARHGFSAAELFRRQPDFLWLPHEDHTQMLREILDSEVFWNHYAFYPDAFFHGIALRIDSPHFLRLSDLVATQWQKVYPGTSMDMFRAERGE